MGTETLHKELITKEKVVDLSMLAFIEQLKIMVTGKDLAEGMACC